MRPKAKTQVRWGLGAAVAALALIGVLAFVPDPFFQQRVIETRLEDVEGLAPGTPVMFRGAEIGEIRSVARESGGLLFAVRLGIERDWPGSACTFARIDDANPLAAPRVELVALPAPRRLCETARIEQGCMLVGRPVAGADRIDACRRAPDLFQTAAKAVGQLAAVASAANGIVQRMTDAAGAGGPGLMQDATATIAALTSLSRRVDESLAPGKGDIALTLANVRQASGRASQFDVATLNGTLREVRALVAQNQASITGLLAEGKDSAAQTRTLLENASASLVATSSSLERASGNLDALSERIAADPTYAIRGQRYADPPPPSGAPK